LQDSRWNALLRHRCQPRAASAQPAGAHDSPQHPLLRSGRRALVRRRRRPDAVLSGRGHGGGVSPLAQGLLRRVRPRLCGVQETVRRILLSETPSGSARRGGPVLRPPPGPARRGTGVRRRAGPFVPGPLPPLHRTPERALHGSPARLPAAPPFPLRRIQPGMGPRHVVRPPIRRPYGIDPHVAAAPVQVVVRVQARPGQRRRAPDGVLPQAAGLGFAVSGDGNAGTDPSSPVTEGAERFPDWRAWPMVRLWERSLTARGWSLKTLRPLNLLARGNGDPLFALLEARGTDPD